MKNEKNDSIINVTDIESQNLEVNNTSSDSLSQNSVKCKERIITKNPRKILSFFRDNSSLLPFKKEEDFKEWLNINYLAGRYNGKFIATENAVENGYMINSKKAVIDLDDLTCVINYSALITPKGQNYILDFFEEVQNERES